MQVAFATAARTHAQTYTKITEATIKIKIGSRNKQSRLARTAARNIVVSE